jgi:regulator of sirC expression with transglutaminase-like and TPR domain
MEPGHVLFSHVVSRADHEIDLATASLLVAEGEYPGLDVAHYVSMLEAMAETVRGRVEGAEARLRALDRHLFDELGFRGNDDDYYDPKNSYLNEVIDRRVGIPITLSVLYLEVGRRVGLSLEGISFPGHFLVRHVFPGGHVVIDPYHHGARLDHDELEERLGVALGEATELSREHLQVATKKQILTRLLNNLRGVFQRAGDALREKDVVERLAILSPQDTRLAEALVALRRRAANVN